MRGTSVALAAFCGALAGLAAGWAGGAGEPVARRLRIRQRLVEEEIEGLSLRLSRREGRAGREQRTTQEARDEQLVKQLQAAAQGRRGLRPVAGDVTDPETREMLARVEAEKRERK
jgi:hypothetical protein